MPSINETQLNTIPIWQRLVYKYANGDAKLVKVMLGEVWEKVS